MMWLKAIQLEYHSIGCEEVIVMLFDFDHSTAIV
jgi:hypothetical protein